MKSFPGGSLKPGERRADYDQNYKANGAVIVHTIEQMLAELKKYASGRYL